jgi:hypothetical protein
MNHKKKIEKTAKIAFFLQIIILYLYTINKQIDKVLQ